MEGKAKKKKISVFNNNNEKIIKDQKKKKVHQMITRQNGEGRFAVGANILLGCKEMYKMIEFYNNPTPLIL